MRKTLLVFIALGTLPLSGCWFPYHHHDDEAYDHHAEHDSCDYDRTGAHGDCRVYSDHDQGPHDDRDGDYYR